MIVSLLLGAILAYMSAIAMFVLGVEKAWPSWTVMVCAWSALLSLALSLVFSLGWGRMYRIFPPWIVVSVYVGQAGLLVAYTVTV